MVKPKNLKYFPKKCDGRNSKKWYFCYRKRDSIPGYYTRRYEIIFTRNNELVGYYTWNPKVNYTHIMLGEISSDKKRPTGLHSENVIDINSHPEYRFASGIKALAKLNPNPSFKNKYDCYKGLYERWEQDNQKWIQTNGKGKFSGFFPKNWNWAKIQQVVLEAYCSDKTDIGVQGDINRWEGVTKNGMKIQGFLEKGQPLIHSAWPII